MEGYCIMSFWNRVKLCLGLDVEVNHIVKKVSPLPIVPEVLRIIDVLKANQYEAYIVGGGIRDLLLKAKPKDFDVVTNARPEQVRKLFKNSIIIGKRFRLVHIRCGRGRNDFIEVATFRSTDRFGFLKFNKINNNCYGDRQSDALRRDFSINALFYDPHKHEVVDYCSGLVAIEQKQIEVIGKPTVRFKEDPVRILRAIRFAAKLNFNLSPDVAEAICKKKHLLHKANADRLFLEIVKLFYSGHGKRSWELLSHYGLVVILFPDLHSCLSVKTNYSAIIKNFLEQAFEHSDQRFSENKTLSPAFLFATLYWFPWQKMRKSIRSRRRQVLRQKMYFLLKSSTKNVGLFNRLCDDIVSIWELQGLFHKCKASSVARVVEHVKFRAAYDFFVLRASAGNAPKDIADWWTTFQAADKDEQQFMLSKLD